MTQVGQTDSSGVVVKDGVYHDGPGDRIMVVVAHPDDAEYMVAGSVARWVKEGREVVYVLCTDGDKGSSDPDLPPERLARIRKQEQLAACKVLGVAEAVFLGYPDGLLQSNLDLRKDIVRQIRRFKPDAILCQDPTRRWYGSVYLHHPDHRAAGDAALDAVFPLARDYHTLPDLIAEGLLPHKVQHVYISSVAENREVWFGIAGTIDTKVEALYAHRSQVGGRSADNGSEEFVRWMAAETASGTGLGLAEAFKYVRLE
jgi:LmbE family N-acetylglucosaminyl deacetylase